MDNKLLTQRQAAELLNVSPRTLEAWRLKGTGPQYIRYSNRCLRYSERDLAEWLAARSIRCAENISNEAKR
jgi:DNA-binding transcriptional MerR regulator